MKIVMSYQLTLATQQIRLYWQTKKLMIQKKTNRLIFGQGFGRITDIEVGPDGFLYVLSYTGSLFRIVPTSSSLGSSITGSNPSNTNPNNEEQQQKSDIPETSEQSNFKNDKSTPAGIVGLNGDSSYSPNPITIENGQSITWYNGDSISHTVTSGQDDDKDAGKEFDSSAIIPNQYFSLEFDDSGKYQYYCFYHPSMIGQIIVK
jgi:plastocyanin